MSEVALRSTSHWGMFTGHVKDGVVTALTPDANDPDPSRLIQGLVAAQANPTRVLHPCVRRDWLEGEGGNPNRSRNDNDFLRVSWDEALDLVAGELRRVRDESGPEAIFAGSYGWASAGRFHHPKGQLNRLLSCFGGYTDQVGNYSYGAGLVILPHVIGASGPVAGLVPSWDAIVEHAQVLVLFGGMPIGNAQVNPGGMGRHRVRDHMRRIAEAGIACVHIGPCQADMPEGMPCEWLAPRPGTDTALMLGVAHTLIVENLHDVDFVTRFCVGFERLRAYILGEEDGIVRSVEWAAQVTGVEADRIRRLARLLAGKRSLISATWALQRAQHGEQPYWMIVALSAMLGQIGQPGCGFGFGYGNISSTGEKRSLVRGPVLPELANPSGSFIPVARTADMLLRPGEDYDFNGERRRYPNIKLVYWAGGNPFHHVQDLNRLTQAWNRPQTVIVHESQWTATARRADIVLPATTTLERNDLGAGKSDRFLIAMHKMVEPPGEARNDFDIFLELAGRLGIRAAFAEGRDETAWLRHLYAQVEVNARKQNIAVPAFHAFWKEGLLELPEAAEPTVPFAEFRKDPQGRPLATPSGRIELYSERIASFGYADCPGHPAWLEPREWLGADKARNYPLHLITHQPRTRLHSQHDFSTISQDAKIHGREPCEMNPDDAARRGLSDGDVVRLFNDRGACLAGLRVNASLRPGVLMLATGAWYDPDDRGLDRGGNPNVLTEDIGTSSLAQGPAPQSALVEAERYDGALPPISAYEPPGILEREAADPQVFSPYANGGLPSRSLE